MRNSTSWKAIGLSAVLLAGGCKGGSGADDGGGLAAGSFCRSVGSSGVSTISAGASVLDPEAMVDGDFDSFATLRTAAASHSSFRVRMPGAAPGSTSGGVLLDALDSDLGGAVSVTVQTYLMEAPVAACNVFEAGSTNGNVTPCTTVSSNGLLFVGAPSQVEYDEIEVVVSHLGSTGDLTTLIFEVCTRDISVL